MAGEADWSATGAPATAPYLGLAVAGGGDVDGDGYDDVVIGTDSADSERGTALVIRGSAGGLSTVVSTRLWGEEEGDTFASALAIVGDVNGDGYDDVLVGASEHGSRYGAAYLFQGAARGLSSAPSTTLTGESVSGYFGGSVAAAGDVNGDGYDDVIVGAYGSSRTVGYVSVYHGSASGLSDPAATRLYAEEEGESFGISVAGLGDVNGDGYDDVAIGAFGADDTTGRATVYLGSASGIGDAPDTTLDGEAAESAFGYALAGVGDLNGDGYDDMAVGAYGYESDTGRVTVYYGSATGIDATSSLTLDAGAVAGNFGHAVAGAGDVDGDGYDDVLVGAHATDSSTGAVALYRGSASGLSTTPTTLGGERSGSRFGHAVAGAGDVDGDGYDDVLVGAYTYGGAVGGAYLFGGSASGLSSAASFKMTGESSDNLGYAVSRVGDVNGDGYDDVALGAPNYGWTRGRALFYLGSEDGLSDSADATLEGTEPSEFGAAISSAGDVDGDGYDDVAILAPTYDISYGLVSVYLGAASGPEETAATEIGNESSGLVLSGVSGVGDLDGDGYDELAVTGRASGTRWVYVHPGSDGGTDRSASAVLSGDDFATWLGSGLSGAGDVDGDGYDELLVGAKSYESYTGIAYVFPGAPDGVETDPSTILIGASTYDYFGSAVASAGDVNGDGYEDVAVGALEASSEAGVVYVFLGAASGLETDPVASLSGEARDDRFGYSLSGAGDVNADGYDDLLVGAYGVGADQGRASLFLGSALGTSSTAALSLDGLADGDSLGFSVSGAGDVDGDGYDDLLVGAYNYEYGSGQASVWLGQETEEDYDGDGSPASEDCDDADSTVSPDTPERCDEHDIDEDCDGLSDDDDPDAAEKVYYYGDGDGDGYGDARSGPYCDPPDGYVSNDDDCDDDAPDINPDAIEVCDPDDVDEDCDGRSDDEDEDVTGLTTWYLDADGDGYGGPLAREACDPRGPGVATSTDCDDESDAVNPGAPELCNDIDDDCDGGTDEEATDAPTWYADADGDGWTDLDAPLALCEAPEGYTRASVADDCDDADPTVYPRAEELPEDGIDQDCDGADLGAEHEPDTGHTGETGGTETGGGAETGGGGETDVRDPTESPEEGAGSKDEGGCGCASSGRASFLALLPALVVASRRRWTRTRPARW